MEHTETGIKLDIRAYPLAEPKGNVVAFASVTIAGLFAVNKIRVVNGENGLFVAMPQIKDARGEYKDICFPVTKEFRTLLNDGILGAYALEKAAQEKESTVDKLREGKREAQRTPALAAEKPARASEAEL